MAYTAVTHFILYLYLFLYCTSFPTLSLLNNFYCDILHLLSTSRNILNIVKKSIHVVISFAVVSKHIYTSIPLSKLFLSEHCWASYQATQICRRNNVYRRWTIHPLLRENRKRIQEHDPASQSSSVNGWVNPEQGAEKCETRIPWAKSSLVRQSPSKEAFSRYISRV